MLINHGFCIVNINGEIYWGEQCISPDRESLQAEVDVLNKDRPELRWHVTPFYARHHYSRMEPTYLNDHPLLSQAHELRVETDKLPGHPEQTDLITLLGDWYDRLEEHLHKHGLIRRVDSGKASP